MSCKTVLQLAHPTNGPHCINGENDDGAHLDDELNEIGPEHGPHTSAGRVRNGDHEADPDGDYFSGNIKSEKSNVVKPQRDREDLDHRLGDPPRIMRFMGMARYSARNPRNAAAGRPL